VRTVNSRSAFLMNITMLYKAGC